MLQEFSDWYKTRLQYRAVITLFILFFVSMLMSCQELQYMVSGKTVNAVCAVQPVKTVEHGQVQQHLMATFTFPENNDVRHERLDLPMDWPDAGKERVMLQYIPGKEGMARLVGQHNYGWVAIFFGSFVFAGIALAVMIRTQ